MKNFTKKSVLALLTLITGATYIYSQDSASWFSEYRTIVPGKHYEAGAIHEFFWGAHWRDIWTTPVRVPVIDLKKYGGGLTPTEKGGGLQTLGLKFKGGDGKEYKFRSLDKDPRKTLPPDLQESVAKDIIQDQISSANPYAGFVVNPILDAVGLYHTEYTLAILPDDPALGKFRSEFGNLLGIMEIVPDEKQFKGSDKVIGSNKLFDRLNKEFDESVDGKEFLKARLIDILVGDWDRHKDQWKWIRYEEGNEKLYKPYPTDRDQAFAKLDGLFPYIAESNIPQLNHFGYSYPKMRFLSWNGRYVDQRFLTFVDKKEWDAVTNDVQSKITDNVIENAVKKLPPEVYNKAKDELTIKLKSRRNKLKEASEEYYQLVNSVVDIYTTDKDDLVEISFNPVTGIDLPATDEDKDVTMITIFKRNKNSGQAMGDVLRQKMFDNYVTDDIRLYVGDGDDEIKISGKTDKMPVIRIIGGDGKDEIINNSTEKVYFYDDGKKSTMKGDVSWDNDKYKYPYEKPLKEYKKKKETLTEEEKDKYEDSIANLRYAPVIPPDKFGMTTFYPIFNYNPDIGIFFGANFGYLKYGFRMKPYNYKLSLTLGYAPEKAGIRGLLADFKGQFLGVAKSMSLDMHLRKSGIEVNNFYGMGNNTIQVDSLRKQKYYKIEHEEYLAGIGITYPRDSKLKFSIGAMVKRFSLDRKQSRISNMLGFADNKVGTTQGYVNGGIEVDLREHPTAPYRGYYFNLTGNFSPKLFNELYQFGRITGDTRAYIGYKTTVSLGLRLRGEKVFGDNFPFFESAFLGGSSTLRGYRSERFAGDGSLMGAAELRLKLFTINFLFPETIGVFGFGETGRVFLKGEESKRWHPSYGGGLFIHFINRDFTFRFTFARSPENDFLFYFNTGFAF